MNDKHRKKLALKIARDIFMVGNELNDPCQRLQFMCGTYPDDEHEAGGLNETGLVKLIDNAILSYQVRNK